MAFVMRDGWKEEPVSITGAEYVEPSASEPLRPGQRVSHLFPRSVMLLAFSRGPYRRRQASRRVAGGGAAGNRERAHRGLDVAVR
jgi:hypothetical protein